MMVMTKRERERLLLPHKREGNQTKTHLLHRTGPDSYNIRLLSEKFPGTEYAELARLARAKCVLGIPPQINRGLERHRTAARRKRRQIFLFVVTLSNSRKSHVWRVWKRRNGCVNIFSNCQSAGRVQRRRSWRWRGRK